MKMWTDTPREIIVGHNMYFTTGICTTNVYVQHNSVPVGGALVCVMAKNDTTFYHYGYTDDNGGIQFIDTLHIPGDSVFITVTGHNLKPYLNARPVLFTGGPYVQLYTYRLLDSVGGNGDGFANPAEDIEIPLCLKNWGNATAYGVSSTIEKIAPDTFYTMYDTVKYIGDIAPYESILIYPDGYNIVIDTNAPDLHEIALRLRIRDSGSSVWTSDFGFRVHAPVLVYEDHYFNGNVEYVPIGDTGQLYVELLNTGTGRADDVVGTISCNDSLVTIVDSTAPFGTILPDSTGTNQSAPFVIITDPNTPIHYSTHIAVTVVSGVYTTTYDLVIYAGQKDYLIWDPDPNHSSGPVIHSLLGSLQYYGDYTTDFPYGYLSLYKSVFICTGVYSDNYPIRDTSQAGQEIGYYIQTQGGKAYLEGGDIWYSALVSHGYDFGQLFGIDPVYNSIGLFTDVTGCTGTFTQNMAFRYTGEATMIDYIDTTGGSQLIFKKANSNYGCGVAANNRTVGISFELGGLADTIAPSTKADLVHAIMNYTLVVYDVAGRVVKTLNPVSSIKNQESVVVWDGIDSVGRSAPLGVYFVRLQAPGTSKTIKTILLR
jgi:hypothetical protein